jgi:hypothetical protein
MYGDGIKSSSKLICQQKITIAVYDLNWLEPP